MKRITGLMKNICTMKNALNAYQKARRCKRYRPEVLEFEANREEYLGKAIRELESLTYTPGKYKVFKVWEPKERIIMALPFYDRDRKSTRLNSSHEWISRMPSSA